MGGAGATSLGAPWASCAEGVGGGFLYMEGGEAGGSGGGSSGDKDDHTAFLGSRGSSSVGIDCQQRQLK